MTNSMSTSSKADVNSGTNKIEVSEALHAGREGNQRAICPGN